MSLRMLDSFDHYGGLASVVAKWNLSATNFGLDAARFGPFGLRLGASNASGTASTQFDAQATWIVGCAVRLNSSYSGQQASTLLNIIDNGTSQMSVSVNAARTLNVNRGGTFLAGGSKVLLSDVWHYVEFKCTINNSTGSYELRIDEVTELSASGTDTQNTANASANQIALGPSTSSQGGYFRYDDLYICDGNGAVNNNFLGDIRVQALFPNGNGNSSQLVGNDGNSTDNYLLVDETAPNDDTDYVESATVNDKDTYAFGDLTPTTGTVHGVQPLIYARKTDANARSIRSVARLAGTEVESADHVMTTTYRYHYDIRETKPGGGAWTISDVNSSEFGVKVTA